MPTVPTSLRFMTSTNMLGFGLASLPGNTTDVRVITEASITFAETNFDSSVAYTYRGRTVTFYGTDLEVMTASTGGPLHYTLSGGQLGAIAITDSGGSPLHVSMTGLDINVATRLLDRFAGPEASFMANLLRGADRLYGSNGSDTLLGFSGKDQLLGGAGNDDLRGGNGDDDLRGGSGKDTLRGDAGNDSLRGGQGMDNLIGGGGNDILMGGTEADRLAGGLGNDTLRGGADRDTISGGDGRDRIWGDSGNDRLSGGAGADVFVLRNHHGNDTITDFTPGLDRVEIQLGNSDPRDVALRYKYDKGNCEVTFLDMKLTILDVKPNALNFASGGDFQLVPF